MAIKYQVNREAATTFLKELLKKHLGATEMDWLENKLTELNKYFLERSYFMAFCGAPRFVGKGSLEITREDLIKADHLRKGFDPQGWTKELMVRVLLLLQLPSEDSAYYHRTLKKLFETSTMNELMAMYAALPLMADPEGLSMRCAEGLRTNMVTVFDAIALQNPYPFDYLEEDAWNQMFLKAAFLDRPLYMVYGVDEKANADLTRIISDYAHERWAASRVVSPELWRPVAKFVNDQLIEDLKRLFADENKLNVQAAALVCHYSDHSGAKALLEDSVEGKKAIADGLDWELLGKAWWALK
ncbi:MAG: EboA domain-containing protein [Cyclobacteriaceae bacterium]|nr:EboA domain-containing protein [Cyclobacteriaceae bacterium]